MAIALQQAIISPIASNINPADEDNNNKEDESVASKGVFVIDTDGSITKERWMEMANNSALEIDWDKIHYYRIFTASQLLCLLRLLPAYVKHFRVTNKR